MQPNPVGIHRVRTKLARTTIHIIHKRLVSTTKSRRTCYADQPTFGIYRIRNEVGTNMQWQVWIGLNCLASIATSLPRIKRSLRKRAPYRDLEEAPKRSGSDYARKCAIFKERIAYLVNRVRGQICPHAESVPSLPLRQWNLPALLWPTAEPACCTESDSEWFHVRVKIYSTKTGTSKYVFLQLLAFFRHCRVHVQIARCLVKLAAHVILEYGLSYKAANKISNWIMSPYQKSEAPWTFPQ